MLAFIGKVVDAVIRWLVKNRDLEADAIEIRLRATRRIDQLRQAQKETVGLATSREGKRKSLGLAENPSDKPTLASQGIDKNLAHQARILAKSSARAFPRVTFDCPVLQRRL